MLSLGVLWRLVISGSVVETCYLWEFYLFYLNHSFLHFLDKMFFSNIQVGDLDINYINLEGLSAHTSPESGRSMLGLQACMHTLPPDTSPCGRRLGEDSEGSLDAAAPQSCMSPPSSRTSNLTLSFGLHGFEKEQSHLTKRR